MTFAAVNATFGVRSQDRPVRLAVLRTADHAHVCLIIGCNAATDEIAISDSGGPEFQERWITVDEAEDITGRETYHLE